MLSRRVNTRYAVMASNAPTTTSRSGWRLPSTQGDGGEEGGGRYDVTGPGEQHGVDDEQADDEHGLLVVGLD